MFLKGFWFHYEMLNFDDGFFFSFPIEDAANGDPFAGDAGEDRAVFIVALVQARDADEATTEDGASSRNVASFIWTLTKQREEELEEHERHLAGCWMTVAVQGGPAGWSQLSAAVKEIGADLEAVGDMPWARMDGTVASLMG